MVLFSLVTGGVCQQRPGRAGGPLAVLFVAIIAAECGKAVSKETKVDILVTPSLPFWWASGRPGSSPPHRGRRQRLGPGDYAGHGAAALLHGDPGLRSGWALALTLPISCAAICAALALTGLAGGAAVAGCCARWWASPSSLPGKPLGRLGVPGPGHLHAQMPNIVRNPRIWIAPTLTSAITGPIATCVFHLEMNGAAINSGMGTCGLCGQLGVWTGWISPARTRFGQRCRGHYPHCL